MLNQVVVAGRLVAHRCESCKGMVFAVCLDGGNVPRMTPCLNPECPGGIAVIFVGGSLDPNMVCWEWYRPSYMERQELKKTDPDQYLAVEQGDLAIRKRNVPLARGHHVIVGS